MKEAFGNIWNLKADAYVVTTNGSVRSDGNAVMGRGIALEAKEEFPGMASWLGYSIRTRGNHVNIVSFPQWNGEEAYEVVIFSFPVKHHWRARADINLIRRSAEELVAFVDELGYMKNVLVPRPGCGNGGLRWEDVKPVIEPILDDRFTVVTWATP